MDWTKMGALASLGCLIMAIIVFGFQIWPGPAIKDRHSPGEGAHKFTVPKSISIFLILSLLLSSFSIYMAWDKFEYRVLPNEKLNRIENKQFINETVVLDGNSYRKCKFFSVRLLFNATENYDLQENSFYGPTVIDSGDRRSGIMARTVVTILKEFGMVDPNKVKFEGKGGIVVLPTPEPKNK